MTKRLDPGQCSRIPAWNALQCYPQEISNAQTARLLDAPEFYVPKLLTVNSGPDRNPDGLRVKIEKNGVGR